MSQRDSTGGHGNGTAHVSVDDADEKSYQELWLTLVRRDWTLMSWRRQIPMVPPSEWPTPWPRWASGSARTR